MLIDGAGELYPAHKVQAFPDADTRSHTAMLHFLPVGQERNAMSVSERRKSAIANLAPCPTRAFLVPDRLEKYSTVPPPARDDGTIVDCRNELRQEKYGTRPSSF